MRWHFLSEATLPPPLLENTRRRQCCRAPLLDKTPFGEQKTCFHRQGLWACECFSCRGMRRASSACRHNHHRPPPASQQSVRGLLPYGSSGCSSVLLVRAADCAAHASWQSRAVPRGQKATACLGRAAPPATAAQLSVMSSYSVRIKLT